jgi:hypothetical protein
VVLNRLLGRSAAVRVPETKRGRVEAELLVFVRSLFSFLDLAAQGAKEDRLPPEAERAAERALASVTKLDQLWPEGDSALVDLRKAAEVIPDYLATFKSWEQLAKQVASDPQYADAKRRFKQIRSKRKEISGTMDKSLTRAIDRLRDAGIDFVAISARAQKTFRKG